MHRHRSRGSPATCYARARMPHAEPSLSLINAARAAVKGRDDALGRVTRSALAVDEVTSRRMRRVRRAGTAPELLVRQALSRHRIRYRVSNATIPGSPDLANRSRGWAVFVHGCFWHRHAGCSRASMPTKNVAFWQRKFERNIQRDAQVLRNLRSAGWRVYIVWECRAATTANAVAMRIVELPHRSIRRG